MNHDVELKVQAYLDGELSGREARAMAGWLARDKEAQSLLDELTMTKAILAANEPEMKLPESREFYWSKIQRDIQRAETMETVAPAGGLLLGWRKYMAPLAGFALVAFLAVGSVKFYNQMVTDDYTRHLVEVENVAEESSSYSFRSHSENMFVVWVYDRDTETSSEVNYLEDTVTQ